MASPADRITLAAMIDQAATPPLTDADLDLCLEQARVVDQQGRPPTDPDWTPTYDLAWAAADTCELRAARTAASEQLTTVTSEGTTLRTTTADWRAMADWWRLRSRATAGTQIVGVVSIDRGSGVPGRPLSSWPGWDDWEGLSRHAIPGIPGNWS